ncbi:MAG: hypothetical protein DMF61_09495 [Blastocatellia bacterium AA13]|nr:MAG: hypothetical protein DMF61_09495 [Blastocatellia bacterium AA13]
MGSKTISRRRFFIESCAGVSSAWLLSNVLDIPFAQEHAHQAALSPTPTKLEFLSPEQAAEIEAIAAQIIPTDETPGAREARVIYFIDRALATFASDDRPAVMKGLDDLQSRVRKRFKNSGKFSELKSKQQIEVLKSIEKGSFFELIRTMTVCGMFADPSYGGNYNEIGWKMVGFSDDFAFEPPFGFYDQESEAK